MADDKVPALSEIPGKSSTRREFLIKSAVLGGLGPLALAACDADTTQRNPAGATAAGQQGTAHPVGNPDSKLDTALGGGSVSASGPNAAAHNLPMHRFDPALPPVARERRSKIEFTAREVPLKIADDVVVSAWTFNGDIPGPILHVKQGDRVDFTLVNHGSIPHSMDFHAAQIDPRTAFRSTLPGQSVSYTFKAKYPGVFMYHCGTSPVLMHIGSGMVGAIVVDPPSPLAAAKEFVLVESEYYLGGINTAGAVHAFDYTKMLATLPDYVVFNGRPSQYMNAPISVNVGDLVRFYVVNAGPTHPCNFHVVGEQFDTVYLAAPPANPLRGVQTCAVAPGGGLIFEMLADVPGEFVFVNHGFGHGQKGAIGILSVKG